MLLNLAKLAKDIEQDAVGELYLPACCVCTIAAPLAALEVTSIFAKYSIFRSKTFTQKCGEKHAKSIADFPQF